VAGVRDDAQARGSVPGGIGKGTDLLPWDIASAPRGTVPQLLESSKVPGVLLEGAGALVEHAPKQETGPYHDHVVYTWGGSRPELALAVSLCLSNLEQFKKEGPESTVTRNKWVIPGGDSMPSSTLLISSEMPAGALARCSSSREFGHDAFREHHGTTRSLERP